MSDIDIVNDLSDFENMLLGSVFKDRNRLRVIDEVKLIEFRDVRTVDVDTSKVSLAAQSKVKDISIGVLVCNIVATIIDSSLSNPTANDSKTVKIIARDVLIVKTDDGIDVDVVNGFKILNATASGYREMFWKDNAATVKAFEEAVKSSIISID